MSTGAGRAADVAWVLRMGVWGVRALGVVVVLALVFTMVNVAGFAAAGHPVGSFAWWTAWLLDPMASITMGTAIVFEGLLAGYGRAVGWLTATKWYAGGCTWAMNIWDSLASGSLAGVVLHSVAPGLVLLLAEAAPRVRREMAGIVADLHNGPPGRSAPPARDHWPPVGLPQATPGQVPPAGPTRTPSGQGGPLATMTTGPRPVAVPAPGEPGPRPGGDPRGAARPASGPGPAGPAGRAVVLGPGTDPDAVLDRVRELLAGTATEGRAPGRRTVARRLGITEHQERSALALAGAATTPPPQRKSTVPGHAQEGPGGR